MEFNPDDLREDLATVAELWRGLENIEVGQKIIVTLKTGMTIEGQKAFFSNGILGIQVNHEWEIPVGSGEIVELDREGKGKPATKIMRQIVYWRYRTDAIIGYGTFPKMAK
ncbi:MAG: hypothetical protein ACW98W_18615 [Candidatus Hodarchaeales archaeon]